MAGPMQLIRLDTLDAQTPPGHWGVASRYVERAGERLTVQHCEMTVDGGAEPHAHDEQDQIFVVLEGALTVRGEGDGDVVVRAGEALRIPAGALHATVNGDARPASYLVLTFPAR